MRNRIQRAMDSEYTLWIIAAAHIAAAFLALAVKVAETCYDMPSDDRNVNKQAMRVTISRLPNMKGMP